MRGQVIRIKPHHFVDIIADYGADDVSLDPHPYGHAVHTVTARLLDDPDVMLEIELGADDICGPCAHNIDGLCDDTLERSLGPDVPHLKRDLNLRLDERWCERLGLKQGDRITAREMCELIASRGWDIGDIYREMRPDIGEEKARNLELGVKKYLDLG